MPEPLFPNNPPGFLRFPPDTSSQIRNCKQ
uniref:Uncharacterized protein n=1 Tax=Arundo donax TaxID=35708 RepID=A0A0A9E955_ARUDO